MKWCCGLDQVALSGGQNGPISVKICTGNSGHSIKVSKFSEGCQDIAWASLNVARTGVEWFVGGSVVQTYINPGSANGMEAGRGSSSPCTELDLQV